ncbi:MAG: hypothetical protein VX733_05035 [Candidatus Latescibacterota bacterium]|nr:hypothetical protein [Candidatus Latescibacterota bacterium]
MSGGIVVVSDHTRAHVVESLISQGFATGAVVVGRGRLPSGAYGSLSEALGRQPRGVAFLTPYSNLGEDCKTCSAAGIPFWVAGPVPGSDPSRSFSRWRHAPEVRALMDGSENAAFGSPVYYRRIIGGGTSLLATWWALEDGLREAQTLLRATPVRRLLSAGKQGRHWHAALHLTMENSSTAQIVVTPSAPIVPADRSLLGTGGMIIVKGAHNAIPVQTSTGTELLYDHTWPEVAWLQAVADASDPAPAEADLLRYLRRAARSRHIETC